MKFRISAIFAEVGVSFQISHKVVKLIWNSLEEQVSLSDIFCKKYNDYTLSFIYSARSNNDFEIKGPTLSKRYKVVEYVIYMPYREILSDMEEYDVFLFYMEKGIRDVFEQYKIDQSKLAGIFSDIRQRVINNLEYKPDNR